MGGSALVLGGGGVTGVAWEIGLLNGLSERGVDLTRAELVVGTSAGSAVGAQVTSGTPLAELYERQLRPSSTEIPARLSGWTLARLMWAMFLERDARQFGARMGRLALATKTMSEAERRVAIAARLPMKQWPERDLKLTCVNAHTGEFRVFDRTSNVELIDAVAASCAVPGVWPPVTLDAQRWIDGGMRSATNADLASGHDRVVILAPIVVGFGSMTPAATYVEALRAGGSKVALLSPDRAALARMGRNTLDPTKREVSAREGYRQAAAVADEVRAVWHS